MQTEVPYGTLDDMLDGLPGSEEGVKVDVGFWDNVSLYHLDRLRGVLTRCVVDVDA